MFNIYFNININFNINFKALFIVVDRGNQLFLSNVILVHGPFDTWCKLNVHYAVRRRPGSLLNELHKFSLCFVSAGFFLLSSTKDEESKKWPTLFSDNKCFVVSLRSSSSSKAKFVKCVHSHLTVPVIFPGTVLQPSLDHTRIWITVRCNKTGCLQFGKIKTSF